MTRTLNNINGALAVVAGRDNLPKLLVEACEASGTPVVVILLEGTEVDWLGDRTVIQASVEKIGAMFSEMHAHDCKAVVFAGRVNRPKLDPSRFDEKFLEIAPALMAALAKGDDGLLRSIAGFFEDEGFQVIGAHEVLPSLLIAQGVPTKAQPSDADRLDASRAAEIAQALGAVDVGQAAVVAQNICLGTESIQGTDAMLAFVGQTAQYARPDPNGAKGVLYKAAKAAQDMRFDLPTIGPRTFEAVAEAGLAGVVVEANTVMMIEADAAIATADRLGLFLWAR